MQNRRDGRLWHDLTDEFGVIWSMPDDHQYHMDISYNPLARATIKDIADYPFPKGNDPSRFEGLRERAMLLKKETPFAVVSGISGVVYEICWYMRGLERWFMDMLSQPEFCEAIKAKIWYHTCWSCMAYVPDLMDNGIDIINPVQISAKNMSPRELKSKFGGRLVFWGGAIDAQHVLPSATADVVREHVRRNLEIWKPGGGYVFNNVHNIQADIPAENIVAFYDAAYEYGFYD